MNFADSSVNSEPLSWHFAHTNVAFNFREVLEGISEVRLFDMIVMKFRDGANVFK